MKYLLALLLPALALGQTVPVTGTAQLPAQSITIPAQTVMIPIAGTSVPFPIPAQTITLPAVSAAVVGTATIPAATPPVVTPPVVTPPVTPPVTAKQAVLSYLASLPGKPQHILIGQHSDYWNASNPMDQIQALKTQSGKQPAIVGVLVDNPTSVEGCGPSGVRGCQFDGVTMANQALANGQLPMVTLVPGTPLNGASMYNSSNAANNTPIAAQNFKNIVIPGTAEYSTYQAYLAQIGAILKGINGPFLFRPFAEQNGSWFWYQDVADPKTFIAMWQMMWQSFQTQGIGNAIWVYAANSGVGNYALGYPGPTYADVVGLDSYPPAVSYDTAAWQQLGALGKPMIYAEAAQALVANGGPAPNTLDNEALLQMVGTNFPNVSAIVFWCQTVGLAVQKNAAAVMNDPQSITQLPAFH